MATPEEIREACLDIEEHVLDATDRLELHNTSAARTPLGVARMAPATSQRAAMLALAVQMGALTTDSRSLNKLLRAHRRFLREIERVLAIAPHTGDPGKAWLYKVTLQIVAEQGGFIEVLKAPDPELDQTFAEDPLNARPIPVDDVLSVTADCTENASRLLTCLSKDLGA